MIIYYKVESTRSHRRAGGQPLRDSNYVDTGMFHCCTSLYCWKSWFEPWPQADRNHTNCTPARRNVSRISFVGAD